MDGQPQPGFGQLAQSFTNVARQVSLIPNFNAVNHGQHVMNQLQRMEAQLQGMQAQLQDINNQQF